MPVEQRYSRHISNPSNPQLASWISNLKLAGLRPGVVVLETDALLAREACPRDLESLFLPEPNQTVAVVFADARADAWDAFTRRTLPRGGAWVRNQAPEYRRVVRRDLVFVEGVPLSIPLPTRIDWHLITGFHAPNVGAVSTYEMLGRTVGGRKLSRPERRFWEPTLARLCCLQHNLTALNRPILPSVQAGQGRAYDGAVRRFWQMLVGLTGRRSAAK